MIRSRHYSKINHLKNTPLINITVCKWLIFDYSTLLLFIINLHFDRFIYMYVDNFVGNFIHRSVICDRCSFRYVTWCHMTHFNDLICRWSRVNKIKRFNFASDRYHRNFIYQKHTIFSIEHWFNFEQLKQHYKSINRWREKYNYKNTWKMLSVIGDCASEWHDYINYYRCAINR